MTPVVNVSTDVRPGVETLMVAQALIDEKVRPFLQSHGGDVHLESFENGVLAVQMAAACRACELKPVTFAARIRATLLELPDVEDVVCSSVGLRGERLDKIAEFFE